MRCETCQFWAEETEECRRYAPKKPSPGVQCNRDGSNPERVALYHKWPRTEREDFCGEWVESPKSKMEMHCMALAAEGTLLREAAKRRGPACDHVWDVDDAGDHVCRNCGYDEWVGE